MSNHAQQFEIRQISAVMLAIDISTQYGHEGIELVKSIFAFETLRIDNEIDHRKLHHRTSCRLHTAISLLTNN